MDCGSSNRLKCLIYGYNIIGISMPSLIDTNKAEIIGYLSKENDKSDFGNYKVFGREILENAEVNLILLCDAVDQELLNELPQNKIVYMYNFIINLNGFGMDFCANMVRYLSDEDYQGIITGLSYLQFGMDANLLNHKFGNLANPGQDIYFDYELFKWAFRNNQNIQYCITGISPYSFWYDLSKSKQSNFRALHYIPYVGNAHYHPNDELYRYMYDTQNVLIKQILKNNYLYLLLECHYLLTGNNFLVEKTDKFDEMILTEDQRNDNIIEINKLFHKPYKQTFFENIQIFEKYMQFTYEHNISTLVILPPYSKLMLDYIPDKMENETLRVLKKLQLKYDFELVDFTRDKDFCDEHFYDFSHLNIWGKKLLTEKIILKNGF